MPDPSTIPPHIGVPLVIALWATWATLAILDLYRRTTMTTTARKYTTGQVADRFGVTTETVRVWADDGKLGPITRTLGGARRFDADHIDRLALAS